MKGRRTGRERERKRKEEKGERTREGVESGWGAHLACREAAIAVLVELACPTSTIPWTPKAAA